MPDGSRILLARILFVCALLPAAGAAAQSPAFFATFAYPQGWSTPAGLYKPAAGAALVQGSPNLAWRKLVWAAAPSWPLVDYLAENVATAAKDAPSRLLLSVTPRPAPGLPAGGAEILSDSRVRTFGFGSYRAGMKVSPPTQGGVGVCNALYIYTPQCELDIEFLSANQGRTPGTGQVEMAVHDHTYVPGNRISLVKYVNLAFDPSREFHVYGFDWQPGRVEFYVDDRPVALIRTGDQGRIVINGVPQYAPLKLPSASNLVSDALRLSNWTDLAAWCGVAPSVKTDFEVDWISYTPFYFTATATEVSVSAGGSAEFKIDAGPARAGSLVLILASPFETNAGMLDPFRPGGVIPFDFDWVLLPMMVELAARGSLTGFLSILDGHGQGAAAFRLSPRQAGLEAVGARLHFACLALHPLFGIIQAGSNRVRIDLVR